MGRRTDGRCIERFNADRFRSSSQRVEARCKLVVARRVARAEQKMPQCRCPQARYPASGGEIRNTEVERASRPGHRNVEQTQILGQTLALGRRERIRVGLEVQHGPPSTVGLLVIGRVARLAQPGPEGHKHDVVLEPLGGMHGDDAHEIGICLQTHARFFGFRRGAALTTEPEQQAMHASERRCGALQQFAEMAHVRESARTIQTRQPARRHVVVRKEARQHHHGPMTPPEFVIAREAVEVPLPGSLVDVDVVMKCVERKIKQRRRQRGAHGGLVARIECCR